MEGDRTITDGKTIKKDGCNGVMFNAVKGTSRLGVKRSFKRSGICGEPWQTWRVSVGGGGTVPVREQRQGQAV